MEQQWYPTLVGVGAALPPLVVSNQEVIDKGRLPLTPEGIEGRTHIRERRHAVDESLTDLATEAGWGALIMAGVDPEDPREVAGLIVATSTPEQDIPSTAAEVHARMGLPGNFVPYDVKAACPGAALALDQASDRLRVRNDRTGSILVIGTNITSRTVDPTCYKTAVLAGDGAGAAVLRMRPGAMRPGMHEEVRSQYVNAIRKARDGTLQMDGRTVKEQGVNMMIRAAIGAAKDAEIYDMRRGRIMWEEKNIILVPHQANGRMIRTVGEKLGVPQDRCLFTVDRHGNTSSASGALSLTDAHHRGKLPDDFIALFTTAGSGLVAKGLAVQTNLSVPSKMPD